jgi:hypothetical protein
MSMDTEAVVFVYTGCQGGERVPDDVICLQVDPSVRSIPSRAFSQRKKLTEVELCEGLVEIGGGSFDDCDHLITKITIPTSLRRINSYAFSKSLQCPIRLHDGIKSIGAYAFCGCIFTNFRVPSLITVISDSMLMDCKSTFSVEMPLTVMMINYFAFKCCHCLRNVAFPPNTDVHDILDGATDLLQLFGSELEIIRNLKNRFNELPVHSSVYYESYHREESIQRTTST